MQRPDCPVIQRSRTDRRLSIHHRIVEDRQGEPRENVPRGKPFPRVNQGPAPWGKRFHDLDDMSKCLRFCDHKISLYRLESVPITIPVRLGRNPAWLTIIRRAPILALCW